MTRRSLFVTQHFDKPDCRHRQAPSKLTTTQHQMINTQLADPQTLLSL